MVILHMNPVFVQDMRGIKVGNIAVFRKSSVCIICNIINSSPHLIIVGKDSGNRVHEGTPESWYTILGKKDELKSFEDKIFDNIITYRDTCRK